MQTSPTLFILSAMSPLLAMARPAMMILTTDTKTLYLVTLYTLFLFEGHYTEPVAVDYLNS